MNDMKKIAYVGICVGCEPFLALAYAHTLAHSVTERVIILDHIDFPMMGIHPMGVEQVSVQFLEVAPQDVLVQQKWPIELLKICPVEPLIFTSTNYDRRDREIIVDMSFFESTSPKVQHVYKNMLLQPKKKHYVSSQLFNRKLGFANGKGERRNIPVKIFHPNFIASQNSLQRPRTLASHHILWWFFCCLIFILVSI